MKQKTIADFILFAQYKPLDFVTYIEFSRLKNEPGIKFDSIRNQMNGAQYFTFKVSTTHGKASTMKTGVGNVDELFDRMEYLRADIENDFYLIDNKDTLKCKLFHFERTYDLNPMLTFNLGLENSKKSVINDLQFVYEDKVFGLGKINMIFNSASLKKIPAIKL